MMDHSFEEHISIVNSLCRLCGLINITTKQKKKYKTPILCSSISKDLSFCGFNISSDIKGVHSEFMCNKCRSSIRNSLSRKSVNPLDRLKNTFEQTNSIWCEFDATKSRELCCVCSHRYGLSRGFLSTIKRPITSNDKSSTLISPDNTGDSIRSTTNELSQSLPTNESETNSISKEIVIQNEGECASRPEDLDDELTLQQLFDLKHYLSNLMHFQAF